jgi:hypothetical protein
MSLRKFSCSVFGIAFCTVAFALLADSPYASAADQPAAGRVVKKIRAKGHLPNYYSEVVTEKQREEIYQIQEEYKPKIDALKAQLEALEKEKMDKISAILTAEQKKKVEEAEAAAKAKRQKDEKPADEKKIENADKPAATSKPADTVKPEEKKDK